MYSANTDFMVSEQRDLVIFSLKMAASSSLCYHDEATSKDAVASLCLKPSLIDAYYKRRVSCFTISFREFELPSEGA